MSLPAHNSFTYTSSAARVIFGAGSLQHLVRETDLRGARRALGLCTPGQRAETAQRGGQGGLDARPGPTRQHRRGAAGRDRDHHRRPVDHGRHDEARKLGIVDHVYRDCAQPRMARHLPVEVAVIGGGDDDD